MNMKYSWGRVKQVGAIMACYIYVAIFLYIYVAIHALASMPSAPRLSEADSKTSTEVPCLYKEN
jgi:hypothetical protein